MVVGDATAGPPSGGAVITYQTGRGYMVLSPARGSSRAGSARDDPLAGEGVMRGDSLVRQSPLHRNRPGGGVARATTSTERELAGGRPDPTTRAVSLRRAARCAPSGERVLYPFTGRRGPAHFAARWSTAFRRLVFLEPAKAGTPTARPVNGYRSHLSPARRSPPPSHRRSNPACVACCVSRT